MNGKTHFSMLARYHRWAYDRLYERVDELDDTDYFADKGLFFGSIHGSLNHLLLVDRLWQARLEGVVTGKVDLAETLQDARRPLRDAIFTQCEQLAAFIDALDADRFDRELRYVNSAGEPAAWPFALLLAHLFNHATHHRGQISTALTQCGLDAPVMDIPYFLAATR